MPRDGIQGLKVDLSMTMLFSEGALEDTCVSALSFFLSRCVTLSQLTLTLKVPVNHVVQSLVSLPDTLAT